MVVLSTLLPFTRHCCHRRRYYYSTVLLSSQRDATLRLLRRLPRGGSLIDTPCDGSRASSVEVRENVLECRTLIGCTSNRTTTLLGGLASTVRPSEEFTGKCLSRLAPAEAYRRGRLGTLEDSKEGGGHDCQGVSRAQAGAVKDSGRHRRDGARHRRLDRGPLDRENDEPTWRLPGSRKSSSVCAAPG